MAGPWLPHCLRHGRPLLRAPSLAGAVRRVGVQVAPTVPASIGIRSGRPEWRCMMRELQGLGLRDVRAERLLSIRELAQRAGVAPSTVFLIEAGRSTPRFSVARLLAAALGVDPQSVSELRCAHPPRRRAGPGGGTAAALRSGRRPAG